jgi:hypothetical protein
VSCSVLSCGCDRRHTDLIRLGSATHFSADHSQTSMSQPDCLDLTADAPGEVVVEELGRGKRRKTGNKR